MAHVTGVSRLAVEQATVEHDPTADSCRDDHADEVALPHGGAAPPLAQGEGLGVVVDEHRNADRVGQAVAERERAPRRDVQRRHLLAARAHGTTTADAADDYVMASTVDAQRILAHTKVLSSDEYEGRGPGTKGEDLTVRYLVDQFKKVGLKPGNTDGTYFQQVPLVGITPDPHTELVFTNTSPKAVSGTAMRRLKFKDDVVAWTKHVADSASIDRSEVVFVGYGVVAPEFNWDDYKGLDVKGKTLVMLVNDPPVPDPGNPNELDAKIFGGKAMSANLDEVKKLSAARP